MDVRTAFMFETLLSVSSSPFTSIGSTCMSRGEEGGGEGEGREVGERRGGEGKGGEGRGEERW